MKPKSGALRAVQRDGGPGEPKIKIDINELKELLSHCLAGSCMLKQTRPDESGFMVVLIGAAGATRKRSRASCWWMQRWDEQSPGAPAAVATSLSMSPEEPATQTPMQAGAPAVDIAAEAAI